MPYTVNSRALTGEKPCINKGFLVPLKHRKLTFNMIVPGPLKLFRHTLFNCHNTINWWSNRPIKMDPLKKKKKKKKMLGQILNPVFLGESPLLYSSRYRAACNVTRYDCILYLSLLSINYVINLCTRHRVVKQN